MSTNNQNSLDWFISQLQKSKDWHRVLNEVSQMNTAKVDIIEQAKSMYEDELEAITIKQSAETSTQNASAYAIGYSSGYKRALDLVKWKIDNELNQDNEQQ